jgi:hypothetical protein
MRLTRLGLDDLERFADILEQKWRQRNPLYYGNVVLTICNTLSSEDFEKERQFDLVRKFATLALKKSNPSPSQRIPLDIECKLLIHLSYEDEMGVSHVADKDWPLHRSAMVRLWLTTWERLEKAIDKNWDPNDVPLKTVPLPQGVSGDPGIDPKDIQDPTQRAAYEAVIEKNRQNVQEYNKQYMLRRLEKFFLPKAEKYMTRVYLKSPYDVNELQRLLDRYVKADEKKAHILRGYAIGLEPLSQKQ